jgi:hypothetical protein
MPCAAQLGRAQAKGVALVEGTECDGTVTLAVTRSGRSIRSVVERGCLRCPSPQLQVKAGQAGHEVESEDGRRGVRQGSYRACGRYSMAGWDAMRG